MYLDWAWTNLWHRSYKLPTHTHTEIICNINHTYDIDHVNFTSDSKGCTLNWWPIKSWCTTTQGECDVHWNIILIWRHTCDLCHHTRYRRVENDINWSSISCVWVSPMYSVIQSPLQKKRDSSTNTSELNRSRTDGTIQLRRGGQREWLCISWQKKQQQILDIICPSRISERVCLLWHKHFFIATKAALMTTLKITGWEVKGRAK